jgi:hypothetical protein
VQILDARLLREAELDVVATTHAKRSRAARALLAWRDAAAAAVAERARAERHAQVWGRIKGWLAPEAASATPAKELADVGRSMHGEAPQGTGAGHGGEQHGLASGSSNERAAGHQRIVDVHQVAVSTRDGSSAREPSAGHFLANLLGEQLDAALGEDVPELHIEDLLSAVAAPTHAGTALQRAQDNIARHAEAEQASEGADAAVWQKNMKRGPSSRPANSRRSLLSSDAKAVPAAASPSKLSQGKPRVAAGLAKLKRAHTGKQPAKLADSKRSPHSGTLSNKDPKRPSAAGKAKALECQASARAADLPPPRGQVLDPLASSPCSSRAPSASFHLLPEVPPPPDTAPSAQPLAVIERSGPFPEAPQRRAGAASTMDNIAGQPGRAQLASFDPLETSSSAGPLPPWFDAAAPQRPQGTASAAATALASLVSESGREESAAEPALAGLLSEMAAFEREHHDCADAHLAHEELGLPDRQEDESSASTRKGSLQTAVARVQQNHQPPPGNLPASSTSDRATGDDVGTTGTVGAQGAEVFAPHMLDKEGQGLNAAEPAPPSFSAASQPQRSELARHSTVSVRSSIDVTPMKPSLRAGWHAKIRPRSESLHSDRTASDTPRELTALAVPHKAAAHARAASFGSRGASGQSSGSGAGAPAASANTADLGLEKVRQHHPNGHTAVCKATAAPFRQSAATSGVGRTSGSSTLALARDSFSVGHDANADNHSQTWQDRAPQSFAGQRAVQNVPLETDAHQVAAAQPAGAGTPVTPASGPEPVGAGDALVCARDQQEEDAAHDAEVATPECRQLDEQTQQPRSSSAASAASSVHQPNAKCPSGREQEAQERNGSGATSTAVPEQELKSCSARIRRSAEVQRARALVAAAEDSQQGSRSSSAKGGDAKQGGRPPHAPPESNVSDSYSSAPCSSVGSSSKSGAGRKRSSADRAPLSMKGPAHSSVVPPVGDARGGAGVEGEELYSIASDSDDDAAWILARARVSGRSSYA